MKHRSILATLLTVASLLTALPTRAADPIQTQSTTEGDVEVDVIKASVKEGTLTIQLAYRNKAGEPAKFYFDAKDVYYIDEKEKKKYHVLKDNKETYIASPIRSKETVLFEIQPKGKMISWYKFPAPASGATKINLVVPNVLPFEDLPISQ